MNWKIKPFHDLNAHDLNLMFMELKKKYLEIQRFRIMKSLFQCLSIFEDSFLILFLSTAIKSMLTENKFYCLSI